VRLDVCGVFLVAAACFGVGCGPSMEDITTRVVDDGEVKVGACLVGMRLPECSLQDNLRLLSDRSCSLSVLERDGSITLQEWPASLMECGHIVDHSDRPVGDTPKCPYDAARIAEREKWADFERRLPSSYCGERRLLLVR
jgi:hypothetical protein